MSAKIKHTGRASSIPGGIAAAAFISIITTVALSAILANLLDNERITWELAGYWIMGILFFSSFVGAKYAIAVVKHQRIAVSAMSGMLYWGLLLCITALLFGGNYDAVWVTFGIIVAGIGCGAMLSMPIKRKYGKKQGRAYR